MTPQFKNMKFKSDRALNRWLNENTHIAIYLKSLGQDMEKMYVHKSGEILDTDYSSVLYAGKFINMEKLKMDCPIEIFEGGKFVPYSKLIVEEIIK